jgi:hypothetical protein
VEPVDQSSSKKHKKPYIYTSMKCNMSSVQKDKQHEGKKMDMGKKRGREKE